MSRRRRVLLALLASLPLVAAACGDSDGDGASGTTTTAADAAVATTAAPRVTSTTAAVSTSAGDTSATPGDVERLQTQLEAVGCFTGTVDGVTGPQTVAAVEAFQEAVDLTVDGIPGPLTQGALDDAVANGRTVCTTGGGDGAGDGDALGDSTVQLASASYSAGFTVRNCDAPTASTLTLSAVDEASAELDVMATEGTGTLSVSGGTAQGAAALTGDVETVTVGDTGAVNVTGTFTGVNLAGEAFTLTGSCA